MWYKNYDEEETSEEKIVKKGLKALKKKDDEVRLTARYYHPDDE